MIRDQELWNKVKNLTGEHREVIRLNQINAEGRLTADEYWTIKAKWSENRAKLRNNKTK